MEGELAAQVGNQHPASGPTNRYETSDGAINIAVAGEVAWKRLCEALGRKVWLDDQAYASNADRWERRDELNAAIQNVIKTAMTAHWVEHLLEAGVPCSPIYRIDEMFDDPQVQHPGIAEQLESEAFGQTRAMAQPVGHMTTGVASASNAFVCLLMLVERPVAHARAISVNIVRLIHMVQMQRARP